MIDPGLISKGVNLKNSEYVKKYKSLVTKNVSSEQRIGVAILLIEALIKESPERAELRWDDIYQRLGETCLRRDLFEKVVSSKGVSFASQTPSVSN